MSDLPLMPKATAVWLIDNTSLTFAQIAEFVGVHELEVSSYADGEAAIGIKGENPIANGQLTQEELDRCQNDPKAKLTLLKPKEITGKRTRKVPRYTPLSKRQDRPAAIAWLVRHHPGLTDGQITRLVGTTRNTIEAVRTRTHWNSANMHPIDPVALGLCKQLDLDEAVAKAAKRQQKTGQLETGDESASLMDINDSLADTVPVEKEDFLAADQKTTDEGDSGDKDKKKQSQDAEALFNLSEASSES